MPGRPQARDIQHVEDMLDEALKQSFPASDPPAAVEPGGGITGIRRNRPLRKGEPAAAAPKVNRDRNRTLMGKE